MSKECVVFGKHFNSVSAVADEYEIPKGTLYGKMNVKHMTAEEAVLDYLNGIRRKDYVIEGKMFKGLVEVAEFYKIPYKVLHKRIIFYKMSIEEAISKPVRAGTFHGKRKCIVNGIVFESLREVADYYGIHYSTLRERCRKGVSVEEAVNFSSRAN